MAYEAGFSGFVLNRVLEHAAIYNFVVNPASIEASAYNRVKIDKHDAQKLALIIEARILKGINIPQTKSNIDVSLPECESNWSENGAPS